MKVYTTDVLRVSENSTAPQVEQGTIAIFAQAGATGGTHMAIRNADGSVDTIATLDESGKIDASSLPEEALIDTLLVSSQEQMVASNAQVGDIAVRTDISKTFILRALPPSSLSNWQELLSPSSQAETGPQGETGAEGVAGPQGPQGVQGEEGMQGATGPSGQAGQTGAIGPEGLQGVTGPAGEVGGEGAQGATGTEGVRGHTGVQGSQGPAGYKGEDGATGLKGLDGTQGTTGLQGSPGTDGDQGATGLQGATGVEGLKGLDGAQGATGTQGIEGERGTPGDRGATGAEGAQGLTGAQGMQGATGVEGLDGAVGSQGQTGLVGAQGTTGLEGVTGAAGLDGAQGSTGLAGAQGVDGAQGATGTGGLEGAQGVTGLEGAQGLTGADGAQGHTGLPGDMGLQGATGVAGDMGLTGYQGQPGATGLNGIQGSTGLSGLEGAKGEQGATGIVGAQGVAGTQGETGTQGLVGATGVQGAIGPQGPAGANGSNGAQGTDGAQGSTGIEGAKGATGTQGLMGAQGEQGDTGVEGAQGLTGHTGVQGLTGAIGATGLEGPQGKEGALGSTGVPGLAGAQGETGIGGAKGDSGDAGVTGAVGATGPSVLLEQAAPGYVAATPSGTTGAPSLRKLVSSDLPDLSDTYTVKSREGASNGVATLDSAGKVVSSQLPAIAITDTFVVASQSAMLALSTAEQGDVCVRTDLNKSFILKEAPYSTLGNWQELLTPTDTVTSVFNRTGVVSSANGDYTASQVTNVPAGGISATTVQGALNELDSEKVSANAAVTGATKTKITFDAKGLVTAGADLVAGDIPDLSSSYVSKSVTSAQTIVSDFTIDKNVPDLSIGTASSLLPRFSLKGGTGYDKLISFVTSGSVGWNLGENTAKRFVLHYYENGAYVDTPITVNNASGGAITLARPVNITSLTASKLIKTDASKNLISYDLVASDIPDLSASYVSKSATSQQNIEGDLAVGMGNSVATLILGDGVDSSYARLRMNGKANCDKGLHFETAGVLHWRTQEDSDATGTFRIRAYDDSGTYIDTPFSITRASTGNISLNRNTAVTGLIYNNISNGGIFGYTNDGADNFTTTLSSTTGQSSLRGGYIVVKGNEVATTGGDVLIEAGNSTAGTGAFKVYTGGAERIALYKDGKQYWAGIAATHLPATGGGFYTNTSDGSDGGFIEVCGGGISSTSRGSRIILNGNERATTGGSVIIDGGDSSSVQGDIVFATNGGTERLRIKKDGSMSVISNASFSAPYTIFNSATPYLCTDTLDTADNKSIILQSFYPGGASYARGGYIALRGNEVATNGGDVLIEAGNSDAGTGEVKILTGANERLRITKAGDLVTNSRLKFSTTTGISTNTVDGSDSQYICLFGGGSLDVTQGGGLRVYGNEVATHGGNVTIDCGDSSVDGSFVARTGSVERLRISKSGMLTTTTAQTKKLTSVATAAATTTLDGTQHIVVFTGTTTQTCTLPAASTGREIIVKNRSTGNVTVNRAGSDTIDGGTSLTLTANQVARLVANGTDWCVL